MPLNTAVMFHTASLFDVREIYTYFFKYLCTFILLVVDVSAGPAITDKSYFYNFQIDFFTFFWSNQVKIIIQK